MADVSCTHNIPVFVINYQIKEHWNWAGISNDRPTQHNRLVLGNGMNLVIATSSYFCNVSNSGWPGMFYSHTDQSIKMDFYCKIFNVFIYFEDSNVFWTNRLGTSVRCIFVSAKYHPHSGTKITTKTTKIKITSIKQF